MTSPGIIRAIASAARKVYRIYIIGNQTVRTGIVFALSAGITRSSSLWLLPLLTSCLTLSDYGKYSLIQISGPILAEILNLNGGAAIIREGVLADQTAFTLLKHFGLINLLVTFGLLLIGRVIGLNLLVLLAFAIGGCEGLHLLLFAYFRVKDNMPHFLLMTFIKLTGQVAILLWAIRFSGGLRMILLWNILISVLISLVFFAVITLSQGAEGRSNVGFKSVIAYTVFLIPHGLAQWVLSGSDRFVIKRFCALSEVGTYNIAYTLAGVVMLVNTGLAMALPQDFFKRYQEWMMGGLRRKFILIYSFLVIGLVWATMFLLRLDHSHWGLIKHFNRDMAMIIVVVATGLYFLGIYYFYVNILFYHRNTWAIARATLVSAVLNLSLTLVLVPLIGILGAAISTLVTYLFYLLYTVKSACDLEPKLKIGMLRDLSVCPLAALLVFSSYLAGRN